MIKKSSYFDGIKIPDYKRIPKSNEKMILKIISREFNKNCDNFKSLTKEM